MSGLMRRIHKMMSVSAVAVALSFSSAIMAADTIKVGVLHSLSGTMAISETTLKDNRSYDG